MILRFCGKRENVIDYDSTEYSFFGHIFSFCHFKYVNIRIYVKQHFENFNHCHLNIMTLFNAKYRNFTIIYLTSLRFISYLFIFYFTISQIKVFCLPWSECWVLRISNTQSSEFERWIAENLSNRVKVNNPTVSRWVSPWRSQDT